MTTIFILAFAVQARAAMVEIEPNFAKKHPEIRLECSPGIQCNSTPPPVKIQPVKIEPREIAYGSTHIKTNGATWTAVDNTGKVLWEAKPFEFCKRDTSTPHLTSSQMKPDGTLVVRYADGVMFTIDQKGTVKCLTPQSPFAREIFAPSDESLSSNFS